MILIIGVLADAKKISLNQWAKPLVNLGSERAITIKKFIHSHST